MIRYVRGLLVLPAALTLILFASGNAYASSVTSVTFAATTSAVAGQAGATWTITAKTTTALGPNATIAVTFNSQFTLPTAMSNVAISFSGSSTHCAMNTSSSSASNSTHTVTIVLQSQGQTCSVAALTTVTVTVQQITNPSAAGSYSVSVSTSADTTPASSPAVAVTAGSAAKVSFSTSPSASATAGVAFANQPVAQVQDANGNLVTSSTASVTLAITNGATGFSCTVNPVSASSGVASFTGCQMTTAGSYTLTATSSGLASATSASFTINPASATKLGFGQQPSDAFVGSAMSPAVTVQIQDTYGNVVTTAAATQITLTPSGSSATGLAATTSSGVATFNAITLGGTGLGLTLTASGAGLTGATSNTFNSVVQVNASASGLTETASDAGSGTKSVSYYYCAGYSNATACTAGNGTLIGTSTVGASNFPVSWTSRPTPTGAYRVVAIGTDNVGNVSSASASTPVNVTG